MTACRPLLWFFAGWYAWALIASAGDLTPLVGPVLVLASVFWDPMHKIWTPGIERLIRRRLE
jgi:hypothetical protein